LVLEVPDKPSFSVYGVIFKKTIIFTLTTLRMSNLFWNKNPENVTLTSTEKLTDFSHPSAYQPPSHCGPPPLQPMATISTLCFMFWVCGWINGRSAVLAQRGLGNSTALTLASQVPHVHT
jgi:hypothetical protein